MQGVWRAASACGTESLVTPRNTALQTTASGAVPTHGYLQLQHPEPQQQALHAAVQVARDEADLGLLLGNLIAAACYGVRGEHRG